MGRESFVFDEEKEESNGRKEEQAKAEETTREGRSPVKAALRRPPANQYVSRGMVPQRTVAMLTPLHAGGGTAAWRR